MSLEIVYTLPPPDIYEACDKAFNVRKRRGVIWTVGGRIYNPAAIVIDDSLMAHETVHSQRQLARGDVGGWWADYLASREFRFSEELPAHVEEWRVIRETIPNRGERRRHLKFVAERLSGGLYGNLVTFKEARRMIVGANSDGARDE